MVTNLMQLYVLPEAGQVEVLKVKVQRIYVPKNLIMIFILFYFFFYAKHFYKHCLSPYFPMRSYFNNYYWSLYTVAHICHGKTYFSKANFTFLLQNLLLRLSSTLGIFKTRNRDQGMGNRDSLKWRIFKSGNI